MVHPAVGLAFKILYKEMTLHYSLTVLFLEYYICVTLITCNKKTKI